MLIAVSIAVGGRLRLSPVDVWRQWDGWWYIGIAQRGYTWSYHGHSALAFFPLFPLLIRAFAATGIPPTLAGLLIANAAFAAALFYLHALAEEVTGREVARRTVWLYSLFPMAFFTFAPYTESVFLVAATGSLYHASRAQAPLSGLWVAAAIMTRATGAILVVPVALLFWHAVTSRPAVIPIPARISHLAWLLTPSVVALTIYGGYLRVHGTALSALTRAQLSWHRSLTWPWVGFVQSVQWPMHHTRALWPWVVETIVSLAVTVAFLTLTVSAWRTLHWPQRLYALGFWALVLSMPEWRDDYFAPFSSVDRFVLVLFPLAWWVAARLSVQRWRWLLWGEAVGLAGGSAAFLAGTWIG